MPANNTAIFFPIQQQSTGMEVPFDLSLSFKSEPVQRLDKASLKWLTPGNNPGVQKAIDQIGALSAKELGLRKPLTSYDKLLDADDEQALYLNWAKNDEKPASSVVYGMLRISRKKLYLNDADGRTYVTTPVCVLDFYVHPSVRKAGHGAAIFDYMLEQEKVTAEKCAYDKPPEVLLAFLQHRYGLKNPVWQTTRFAVFPGFFEGLEQTENRAKDYSRPSSARPRSSYQATSSVFFNSTPRSQRPESVGGLIHGETALPARIAAPPDTPQGRKNTRDFGHTSIW